MTAGLSAANFANEILDSFDGTATDINLVASHVQLHDGDPGASGTANTSAETDRQSLSWGATAGGSRSIDNTPEWADWDSGTETISHISVWNQATTGTFRFSAELQTPREVQNDDTLRLTSLTFAFTPIAA